MTKPSSLLRVLSIFFVVLAATSVASAGGRTKPSRSEQLRQNARAHDTKGDTAAAERSRKLAEHHAKLEERDRKRAAEKAAAANRKRR